MEHKYFAHCFSQWIRQYFSWEVRVVEYVKIDKGLLAVPFQKKNSTFCAGSLHFLIFTGNFGASMSALLVCKYTVC